MSKILALIILVGIISGYVQMTEASIPPIVQAQNSSEQTIKNAFEKQKSNIQVTGQGKVIKLLADDLDGSRHQRFIVRLSSGQTLLIAHNIDLSPRINSLKLGDPVAFYGEYEWSAQGGTIHWTHKDPAGRHIGGWIKHGDKIYQ